MRTLFIIGLFFSATLSFAQASPNDMLEQRARDVGNALRCVVCQNQSIEESDASLAKDMRQIVRERLEQGETDAQVIEFMRTRYGDYVLLKPPVQRNTYALWFLPILIVLGMGIWFLSLRRPRNDVTPPEEKLTEEELKTLKRLMDNTT